MIKNIFFIILGFLLGVFLTSSLSWRDINFENLKQDPWGEILRLRSIITEKPKPDTHTKVVTKIIDGDTLLVEGGEQVRLLGIDADEKGEPCYEVAKERLKELTLGKTVTLLRGANDRDEYGRLLRFIIVGERNVSLELVKEGLVVTYFPPTSTLYKDQLIWAEQEAKRNKVGCKWKNLAD